MLDFLKETIKEAGYLAKGFYIRGVKSSVKSAPFDLLTEADLAVEKFLVDKIKEQYPAHGIISEETAEEHNPGAEYTWVIDPIDGTRNFAKHIAVWCTMVGLTKNGKPYLGAIYDAMNDELFYAQAGKGAFLNDKPIKVDTYNDVENCFLMFSAGEAKNNPKKYKSYIRFHNNLQGEKGHWVHNYGTMLSLCHLAAGRIDAVVCNGGYYHDYLAGYVIATEACARWTNSMGGVWKRGEMDIVVANPKLHKKLLKLF
jgi:myo-inositol-1(or 4)-monophosphatase